MNSIQWQIGLDVYDVTGPEEFVEKKVGIYYTGRIKIKRWGKNMDVDMSEYQWDPDAGERWHVLREAIYYDHDQRGYSLGYQGPNVLPEFYNVKEYTEEIHGPEPDWSVFK